MFRESIPVKQLATWLCAALIPVWIQLTAGESWLSVATMAVLDGVVVWAVWRWGRWENKLMLGLGIAFEVLLLGSLLPCAALVWPDGNQYPAVPLGILALSAWSAWKGPREAAGVGCVLYWVVLVVYLLILGVGIGEIQVQWLAPERPNLLPLAMTVGLLPGAAAVWKGEESRWIAKLILPMVMATLAAVVTAGALSPWLAKETENGFLRLSEGLSIFGMARHFEAVASAAMTVGWFVTATVLLSLCAAQAEKIGAKKPRAVILVCALASALWMLCEMHISGGILLIFGSVCWAFLPLLPQGIEVEKKS